MTIFSKTVCPGAIDLPAFLAMITKVGFSSSLDTFFTLLPFMKSVAPPPKLLPDIISFFPLARALSISGGTLAGVDLGDKTIGLAISDRSFAFAHPRPVIMRRKFSLDAATLVEALSKEEARAVVIGLPVNMDGSEGPRVQASRAFVRCFYSMKCGISIGLPEPISTALPPAGSSSSTSRA